MVGLLLDWLQDQVNQQSLLVNHLLMPNDGVVAAFLVMKLMQMIMTMQMLMLMKAGV